MKAIETEADHKAALREIEQLWGAKEGTPEGDRLDSLANLIEAYEEANFPIELPIEAAFPVASIRLLQLEADSI